MSNINIDDDIYVKWKEYHKRHNKTMFPTLKSFTENMLLHIMDMNMIIVTKSYGGMKQNGKPKGFKGKFTG